MPNFIRAEFCIYRLVDSGELYELLEAIQKAGCRYKSYTASPIWWEDPPDTSQPVNSDAEVGSWGLAEAFVKSSYATVEFDWSVSGDIYLVNVAYWNQENRWIRLALNFEERIFLPGLKHEFTPALDDELFMGFKQLLVELIRYTRPEIGMVGYEADLLCENLEHSGSVVYWGNYFPFPFLNRLSEQSRQRLLSTVSEYREVESLGILTFIHPLIYPYHINQEWMARLQSVHELIHNEVARKNDS
jgi:hypothetical protein